MTQTILGIFENRVDADSTIDDLYAVGFDSKAISVMMKDSGNIREVHGAKGNAVSEGIISGAATGGVVGGIAGLLIGIGAIAIPGIGALLIGGPLALSLGLTGAAATTVSAAATGVIAGGIIGGLVGLGVPEEEAKVYEDKIKKGAILLAVAASPVIEEEVIEILEDNNATHIRTISAPENASIEEVDQEAYTLRQHAYVGVKGGRRKRKRKQITAQE